MWLLRGAFNICKQLRNAVGAVICIPLRGAWQSRGGEACPRRPQRLEPASPGLPHCCPLRLASGALGGVPMGRRWGAGAELRPCSSSLICWLCSGAHVHPTWCCASPSTPTDSILPAPPPTPNPVFPGPSGVALSQRPPLGAALSPRPGPQLWCLEIRVGFSNSLQLGFHTHWHFDLRLNKSGDSLHVSPWIPRQEAAAWPLNSPLRPFLPAPPASHPVLFRWGLRAGPSGTDPRGCTCSRSQAGKLEAPEGQELRGGAGPR